MAILTSSICTSSSSVLCYSFALLVWLQRLEYSNVQLQVLLLFFFLIEICVLKYKHQSHFAQSLMQKDEEALYHQ